MVDATGVVAGERDTAWRHCIVCGDNRLAFRLADELVSRYGMRSP